MLFPPKHFKTQWHHWNAAFMGFHTCGAEKHLRQVLQLFLFFPGSAGKSQETWGSLSDGCSQVAWRNCNSKKILYLSVAKFAAVPCSGTQCSPKAVGSNCSLNYLSPSPSSAQRICSDCKAALWPFENFEMCFPHYQISHYKTSEKGK